MYSILVTKEKNCSRAFPRSVLRSSNFASAEGRPVLAMNFVRVVITYASGEMLIYIVHPRIHRASHNV